MNIFFNTKQTYYLYYLTIDVNLLTVMKLNSFRLISRMFLCQVNILFGLSLQK
jgi:hypothetical protein